MRIPLAFVEFNGWPAGIIPASSERGGWIAAGSAANEDELIMEALR